MREIRRVPAGWEHPKDEEGNYIPLLERMPTPEEIEKKLRNILCDFMPPWPDTERSHYQMYETVTEGTPISPVMETQEGLARWCTVNRAYANPTASYDQWLAMIKGSSVGTPARPI